MKCVNEVLECLTKIESCIYDEKHQDGFIRGDETLASVEMLIAECIKVIELSGNHIKKE